MALRLCRHDRYQVIDWIKTEKWSTDEVLINASKVKANVPNVLLKFTMSTKYPDWLHFNVKDVISSPKQKNGAIEVYVLPMYKRNELELLKNCLHEV